ncbi:biotin synthase [Ramlibacter aquaticus]|uniref:Biotin synthase n=1 Tax=Ramlibacter aquaticus TaxID=2780094 RepID=A0ABR9SD50_9BURK|nr:biotin synthase [Ramlibacter aquaticus]MBE7940281.1 biotin synthase [Ramlibacter aquaticus]
MATDLPPSLDPVAARRWQARAPAASPWLHEEVGRRMAERLEWIRLAPRQWVDWEPVRGGLAAHALVQARYPQAACTAVEPVPARAEAARAALARPWWKRWGAGLEFTDPAPGAAQMLWSNMALHDAPDPQALIARWHAALATDGFLMFSCLGPDTLRELRALYLALGWPPPAHEFTDMHDWGDMLVHAGFAEPVMDMERITLTWGSPQALLDELRGLGTNLATARFPGLRGRGWRESLLRELSARLAGSDGRLALTFEIIYGHALKPAPRVKVASESAVSLRDMQQLLQSGRKLGR